MSIKVMSMVWEADNQFLTSSEKSILLRLADFGADDGSSIFPSIGRLEKDTGISRSWIIKILKTLQEKKVLFKEQEGNKAKRLSCVYKIMVDVLKGMERAKPDLVYPVHHPSVLSTPVLVYPVHHPSVLSTPQPLLEPNTNTSFCTNCAEKQDQPLGDEKKKPSKREVKTIKADRFRADKLEIDFVFKCTAVKHGMDRTWIATEFEEFKAWWVDAPQKNNPCKTLGHWKQAWNNWCSRIGATLKEPQPDVTVKDEFIPSTASVEKLLSIAKDPDYPYYDKVMQAGGFDHCYKYGFPRPAPGDTSKRNVQ